MPKKIATKTKGITRINDPGHHGPSFGGFYQALDTNVRDRYFWSEAPRYALGRTLQGMLALAEAADGIDEVRIDQFAARSVRGGGVAITGHPQ